MSKCDNPTCWQCVQDEIQRLQAQMKIATDALDQIVMRGRSPGAWVIADDALTQISVVE